MTDQSLFDNKRLDMHQLIWALRFYADGGKDTGELATKVLNRLTFYGFCGDCGKIVHRNFNGGLHAHQTRGWRPPSTTGSRRCIGTGVQPLTFGDPPPVVEPAPLPDNERDDATIRFSLLELD